MAAKAMSRAAAAMQLRCKYHPEAELVEDYHAGDVICPECGLIVGDRIIDVGSEWRTFSSDTNSKDASRVGGPENSLLEGGDLSTTISMGTGDASFDANGRPVYRNRRQLSSTDRALLSAFREISEMAERINLPKSIVDQANVLFKQVQESKTLRGRNSDAICSACLYIACRQDNVPRTFKEICAVSKTSKKDIGRVFQLIRKNIQSTSVDLIQSGDFMSRFCAKLNLPNKIEKAATLIARKAGELDLVPGRSPVSVTAAAIYMASQASEFKKSPKDVSEASGVAEATIRVSYKLMYPKAHLLFPEDFKFHTSIGHLPTQ